MSREKRIIKEHVTNIVSNKKLLITMIITVLVLITLLSGSFAIFMRNSESEKKDLYKSGTLTVILDKDTEGEPISINPARPISDEYAISTIDPYEFAIKNTGTTIATFDIYLNDEITNSNGLSDEQVRQHIKYQINQEEPKFLSETNNIVSSGGIRSGATLNFKLRLWIDINSDIDMGGTVYKANIEIKSKAVNSYDFDPNPPELAEGMIPVLYDFESKVWIKADENNIDTKYKWYDYKKQMWANAVTVTSDKREEYISAPSGTPISMDDINSMWVWIPRFKYKITKDIGSLTSITDPPMIDILFEDGVEATGVEEKNYRKGITEKGTNANHYTHPAFRDGTNIKNEVNYDIGGWDEELTGIWVSKFQTSGDATSPLIKPDSEFLHNQDVKTAFKTSLVFAGGKIDDTTGEVTFETNVDNPYGLNTKNNTTNTHMMKNTEWGAVAILSQSKYGKMGNTNYEGEEKQVFINNSKTYTGKSAGSVSNVSKTYSYNEEKTGTGASTTGTIYGVYDMNGGLNPLVMAIKNDELDSGFEVMPNDQKYYDKYKTIENADSFKSWAILGDATWETSKWHNAHSINSESFNFKYKWIHRGGYHNAGYVGYEVQGGIGDIFSFNTNYMGNGISHTSSLSVLIP